MTPEQIMTTLGIAKYKTNPTINYSGEQYYSLSEKYGMYSAIEVTKWKIGPYCNNSSCYIPYGVNVGVDGSIPVKISILFTEDQHQIYDIDVHFNSVFWDEIVPILNRKYGSLWEIERMPIAITDSDFSSKKTHWNKFDRIIMIHKTGGINTKTKDTCEISATNYDVVSTHHDPIGAYQSVMEIKLISTNF